MKLKRWRALLVLGGLIVAVGAVLVALGVATIISSIPNPATPLFDWPTLRSTLVLGAVVFVPGRLLWDYASRREREAMGLTGDAGSGADESSAS